MSSQRRRGFLVVCTIAMGAVCLAGEFRTRVRLGRLCARGSDPSGGSLRSHGPADGLEALIATRIATAMNVCGVFGSR